MVLLFFFLFKIAPMFIAIDTQADCKKLLFYWYKDRAFDSCDVIVGMREMLVVALGPYILSASKVSLGKSC